MVAEAGFEPRRRKLRIVRTRALKLLYARALIHSAAPPSPKKSLGLFGDPVFQRSQVLTCI